MDALADDMSQAASLASAMSAYTDRSTAAGSTHASGSSASTVGGRRSKRKEKGRGGKIRQGAPEEEQKLCSLLCALAPRADVCGQVCFP